jgi:hypothetical protein
VPEPGAAPGIGLVYDAGIVSFAGAMPSAEFMLGSGIVPGVELA